MARVPIIRSNTPLKLLTYSLGIEKLKRREKARNNDNEQIKRSILKIIQAGVVERNARAIRNTKLDIC